MCGLRVAKKRESMSTALFSDKPSRVKTMKGLDSMYDATLQECLLRPFYLFARGRGRSCRKEIWVFTIIFMLLIRFVAAFFSAKAWVIIPIALYVICLVPRVSLLIRRLHDLMVSGWLALIPGAFTVVVSGLLMKSEMSVGRYHGLSEIVVAVLLIDVLSQLVIMCFPSRVMGADASKDVSTRSQLLGERTPSKRHKASAEHRRKR